MELGVWSSGGKARNGTRIKAMEVKVGMSAGRVRNEEDFNRRKCRIMEACYDCYAENGFYGTGIKQLASSCGCTSANLYIYFENIDDLIVQSTEYCMGQVEADYMERAPSNINELFAYIDEIPRWTAKAHGKRYRLMYQIYTHPKYMEHGRVFFDGARLRYEEYAKLLEQRLGIPYQRILPFIFMFVRACVHYSLFGDEECLNIQTGVLKEALTLICQRYIVTEE